MPTKSTLLHLLQASAIGAMAQPLDHVGARDQKILWGSCTLNSSLPIECANFSVPLDYSSPNSTETLTLELLKVPAAKPPSKGSVLLNFGGPGLAAREDLAAIVEQLKAMTGGFHDLITFDPR